MQIYNINNFIRGWFIGDFVPSILKTDQFEVCFKEFKAGYTEKKSVQILATEVTLVISGKILINDKILLPGEICLILPGEGASFDAISDCSVIGIKTPSLPQDKRLIS